MFGGLGLRDLCGVAIHSQNIDESSEIAALAHNRPPTIRALATGQDRDRLTPPTSAIAESCRP